MEIAKVNGVELEYEVTGRGEPVLFISSVLADGFAPLLHHPELNARYRMMHYHRRGWAGSTHGDGLTTIADHAADAAALLEFLGVTCAHVAGHSSGAAVAVQLALDSPRAVHSLILLELSLLSLPEGQAFLADAGPILERYESGDHADAFAAFMTAVSGLEWPACRALLEERVPGVVDQSIADAHTFFGVELPSLARWALDPADAAGIRQPVLSVRGTGTLPLWVEVAAFLRRCLPHVDECVVDGAGHLLHIQRPEPVARGVQRFLERQPMAS